MKQRLIKESKDEIIIRASNMNKPELRGDVKKLTGDIQGVYGRISCSLHGKVTYITGDVTGLYGDISCLKGDVSNIFGELHYIDGDVTNIKGDITDLCADVSYLTGDVSGLIGACRRYIEDGEHSIIYGGNATGLILDLNNKFEHVLEKINSDYVYPIEDLITK